MVEERCTYKPNPENGEWTDCHREAWITSKLYGFSYALQTFGYERFKKNAGRSIKGFNHALNRLFTGETSVHTDQKQSNTEKLRDTAMAAKELAASIVAIN